MARLADLLQAEIQKLQPHEIKVFRRELQRSLPAFIQELGARAREGGRALEKQTGKKKELQRGREKGKISKDSD